MAEEKHHLHRQKTSKGFKMILHEVPAHHSKPLFCKSLFLEFDSASWFFLPLLVSLEPNRVLLRQENLN